LTSKVSSGLSLETLFQDVYVVKRENIPEDTQTDVHLKQVRNLILKYKLHKEDENV